MKKCGTCGKKLSKADMEFMFVFFGENLEEFNKDEDKLWCDKCGEEASRELLDTLSEARYGEPGQFDSWADVDPNDGFGI